MAGLRRRGKNPHAEADQFRRRAVIGFAVVGACLVALAAWYFKLQVIDHDDYATRSGYVITPVVMWGGGRLDPQPSPDEVLAVYRVGLHQLQRPDSPRFISIPESDRPVVQIPLGNDLVHAPTGAVLLQMRWLGLEGRPDPVDELEQPVFAWR